MFSISPVAIINVMILSTVFALLSWYCFGKETGIRYFDFNIIGILWTFYSMSILTIHVFINTIKSTLILILI